MLRKLVRNGSKTENFRFIIPNKEILRICQTDDIGTFVAKQQANYLAHLARQPNQCLTKKLLFNTNKRTRLGPPAESLEDKVLKSTGQSRDEFYRDALQYVAKDMIHPTGRIANSHQTDDLAKQPSTSK